MLKLLAGKSVLLIAIALMLGMAGCAAVQQAINIRKPTVGVDKVRLTGLSFDSLGLVFDLVVNNPNPVSATLSGFDYDFQVGSASLVKGNQARSVDLQAEGKSIVQVPVTLGFQDLYKAVKSFQTDDSTAYKLLCGLSFDLPVLGPTRIPLSTTGKIPNVKVPSVSAGSIKLKNISLTSADLELQLNINNPNAFGFLLNNLNYNLAVGGANWAKGASQNQVSIKEKGESTIAIPFSLNLVEMGTSAYQMLTSSNPSVQYQLTGGLDLSSPGVAMLGQVHLPFNKSGSTKIVK